MNIQIKGIKQGANTYRGTVVGIRYDFDGEAGTPAPKYKARCRLFGSDGSAHSGAIEATSLEELVEAAPSVIS